MNSPHDSERNEKEQRTLKEREGPGGSGSVPDFICRLENRNYFASPSREGQRRRRRREGGGDSESEAPQVERSSHVLFLFRCNRQNDRQARASIMGPVD